MKRFYVLLLLASLAGLGSAHADLTIIEKVEGMGAPSTITVKIKGSKMRVDAASEVATIFDAGTGEMLQLSKTHKSVIRISGEKMKAMSELMGQQKDKAAAKAKLTPTGKTEKVEGYDTEEFVSDTPEFKASYWVAKNYPDSAAIFQELQSIKPPNWDFAKMGFPDFTDLPGLPIKTVMSFNGTNVTSTITSINRQPVDAGDFSVPPDFEEMKLPDLGGILNSQRKEHPVTASPKPE